jgi:microcin C transport system permease protein
LIAYIARRLLLMIPTIFAIMVINFAVVQVVPGGPVERVLARLEQPGAGALGRVTGASTEVQANPGAGKTYRGAQGLDPELIAQLQHQFGFDQPLHVRFFKMLWSYARFDLGQSFFRESSVMQLIASKLPVSISLGLWTTLLIYLISIPLGIAKAVRDGSRFDVYSSSVVIAGNAIPSFMFAVGLIVLFAGGSYLDWFPLRGLVSPNWESLGWPARIADYFWHIALPVLALVVGGFASLTILTKNSFLDEIHKQYVVTARAKGLPERRVLYGHVFRNAMLIVISGFPGAFLAIFFTGSLLIEVIFSLDGLGLLGFEAALDRDYPVVLGSLYLFSLLGLGVGLLSDLTYMLVDPRIDFESRQV